MFLVELSINFRTLLMRYIFREIPDAKQISSKRLFPWSFLGGSTDTQALENLILVSGFAGFSSYFKNPISLAEKSCWSYVGLYQKFLYKISPLLLTPPPPPKHSYYTSLM